MSTHVHDVNGNSTQVLGPLLDGFDEILTAEALAFVGDLVRSFRPRIAELLDRRRQRQELFDGGGRPDFLAETAAIREGDWTVAPIPGDLRSRAVEITGPTGRKMVINALNSGANVFMADFEDSLAPSWFNVIDGQRNLRDAVAGTIRFEHPTKDKVYTLNDRTARLFVRPRGLHLLERHLEVDGQAAPASLVDFGLFLFHNGEALVAKGTGPYFYLPKLESRLEARLWNDVFVRAQKGLGLPVGTVRATVLIETLPAAFEMDEILWELKDHCAGLNCGRWDYIFSAIKTLREHGDRVLPDRDQVGMTQPFMRAYSQLLIRTCHRRGVHAMGGMAAQIPIKSDPAANEVALGKVRADKEREARDGHDGTWVAHPGLVSLAAGVFDAQMTGANQIQRKREDVRVTAEDLLAVPTGTRTLEGLRKNLRVGVQYLAAWLGGQGCVPLYHLMEDAATAEISRAQIWQQVRHGAALDSGEVVTKDLVSTLLAEELTLLDKELTAESALSQAADLFLDLSTSEALTDFLTVPAYELLTTEPS